MTRCAHPHRGRLSSISTDYLLDFREQPDLTVIADVSDGLEAVHKAAVLKPDLILMDIGLPAINGIEAARRIHKLSPESKIVFLSQETSADIVNKALSTGA